MRNVNNLLDRLKGIQRELATHIVLEINKGWFKEYTFTIDMLSKKFYTNRSTVYIVIDKLLISEIVSMEKPSIGTYKLRRYNEDSFIKVAEIFKQEVGA